jgi:hypothetical protein
MCINCVSGIEVVVAGGLGAAGLVAKARIGLRMWLGRSNAKSSSRLLASRGQSLLLYGRPAPTQQQRTGGDVHVC